MKILIDTAVLLWAASDKIEKLSEKALSFFKDENCSLFLSAVTTWEIAIKSHSGKLVLHQDLADFVKNSLNKLSLTPLLITHSHTLETARLPFHHKDPFDRLLVAQAQAEKLSILSPDVELKKYDVEVIW